jgi:hypothetical protein
MAERESSFRPETKYQEAFDDVQGAPVISRGLLQISLESTTYYGCRWKNAQEIHDAEKNIHCSLRMLSRWLYKDTVISDYQNNRWLGGARYWAVLRKTTLDKIKNSTRSIPICKRNG